METLKIFKAIDKVPGGSALFSWAVSVAAPYFRSIKPKVDELRPGYCSIRMKKRWSVQNHLKTVHAIAMCNMAEFAGGLMTEASVGEGSRWIPSGMSVKYIKKAKTDLVAVSDGSNLNWLEEGELVVPVVITDTSGDVVFTAEITMNIKHS